MGVRLPEYLTTEDIIYQKSMDSLTLPGGSFVKPVSDYWLPKHIKDSRDYYWMNHEKEVYCYTAHGMIILPWDKLRIV